MSEKTCSHCKAIKPFNLFAKDSCKHDGLSCYCKECINLKRRQRYHDGEKARYNTVRGKCIQLCSNAKMRAKKRGLAFDLTSSFLEQLWHDQDGRCAITGVEFQMDADNAWAGDGPALDKIDSTKGYTKDNVQWLCSWVNSMKSTHSMDDFTAKVKLLNDALNAKSLGEILS